MNLALAALATTASWSALTPATASLAADAASTSAERSHALRGALGTYGRGIINFVPEGLSDGKEAAVDLKRLLSQLVDIKAKTYIWEIWRSPSDWDDLKVFLPLARQHGIAVWVEIMPHMTRPASKPFGSDCDRWATEIAKLSLKEPNLAAWGIDDFTNDLRRYGSPRTYTPAVVRQFVEKARAINPRLAFIPCCYYPQLTAAFARDYRGLIDGVLFPYRHESAGANLTDPSLVETEVKAIKEALGPSVPVIFTFYATAHSRLGSTTPEYVRQVMIAGRRCSDGLIVYCHQDPERSPEKYRIIKELFAKWSAEENK